MKHPTPYEVLEPYRIDRNRLNALLKQLDLLMDAKTWQNDPNRIANTLASAINHLQTLVEKLQKDTVTTGQKRGN